MRQFAGVQYDAFVSKGDFEAQELLFVIEKSLDDAGWQEVACGLETLLMRRDNKPPVCIRSPGVKNVIVAFAPDRASQLEYIAFALASALTAEGIAASSASANIGYQTDAVHILIGQKT